MRVVENFNKIRMNEEVECKYSYRILESNYKGMVAYGIEVEKGDFIGDELINIDRDSVYKITCHLDKVQQLVKMLYHYEVSPIHLIDIIGEYVDEYVNDFDICA